MPGLGRVRFDLGPEPLHVDVQGLGVANVVGAPDPVDQLHPGKDAVGVAQQDLEQFELLERELHRITANADYVPLHVHPDRAGFQRRLGDLLHVPAAAEHPRIRATSSRDENGLVT